MSTKIYYGFRFTTMDFRRIHKYLMEFRAELEPLVQDKYAQFLAYRCATMYDRLIMGMHPGCDKDDSRNPCSHGVFVEAFQEFEERRREVAKTGLRDPIIDLEVSMAIIPIPMKTLGIIYTEQNEFRELWFNKPFVKEYGYWNNTDMPEELTTRQWNRREKDWDAALEHFDGIPSMNGFGIDCTAKYAGRPDAEQVLSLMPPHSKRAKSIAKSKMFDDRIKKKFKSKKKIDLDVWMKEHRAFNRYVTHNTYGQEALKRRIQAAKKALPRRLSRKALFREFDKIPCDSLKVVSKKKGVFD